MTADLCARLQQGMGIWVHESVWRMGVCGKFVISFYRIGRSFLFPFYEACDINYACNGLSVPFAGTIGRFCFKVRRERIHVTVENLEKVGREEHLLLDRMLIKGVLCCLHFLS